MPSGSALLAYVLTFEQELVSVILDAVEWSQVQQYNHIHNFTRSSIEQWATKGSHALMHRLLPFPTSSPRHGLAGILAESIKQSIFIAIADVKAARRSRTNASSVRDPTTSSWSNVNRLYLALSTIIHSSEDWRPEHEELVLWMTCLGVQNPTAPGTTTTRTQPSPPSSDEENHHAWFVSLARHILDRMRRAEPSQPTTADQLVQVMSRYLHRCEPPGQPSVDGLEEVLVHRQRECATSTLGP